tara:strand:- start:5693 stop:6418 length:726 start_codon:yes stop_codon:yes gene_type:complete
MKYILITGVSRGLGLITAKKMLKNGFNVIGINRKTSKELNQLLRDYSESFIFIEFDFSEIDKIKKEVFLPILKQDKQIIGFINNAASAYDDIITNTNNARLTNMFNINVLSPIMLTKYIIRNMLLNRNAGSIVHISSISVHTGYKGLAMYAASKGALEAFSKNTAREWGIKKIRSNCVVAGFMETEMSSSLNIEQKSRIYNRTSLKSKTSIESVAETILFLISDKSKSITGQNIFVDSGTI